MMRILLIEDEVKTADYMRQGLTESGYVVDVSNNGVNGCHLALTYNYDAIILDINLPEMEGWDVLKKIREHKEAGIIIVSARGRLEEKVRGLDLGADDYIVKPFQFPELLARIKTLIRRTDSSPLSPDVLVVDDLQLDQGRHRAVRAGKRIDLTAKEFTLLHFLMRHAGEVLTRTQVVSTVWDINFDCDTNVVEVAIRRLRAKIDDPFDRKLIHTLRGVGYVLESRE